jgi:hypothetical protein
MAGIFSFFYLCVRLYVTGEERKAAVKKVLKEGYRTIDIMPREESKRLTVTQLGTSEMGDKICKYI